MIINEKGHLMLDLETTGLIAKPKLRPPISETGDRMTTLKNGSLEAKGEWRRGRVGTMQGEQRITALVSCPGCGKTISLSKHGINPDGTVSPSLICPHGCGFHDFIKLEGWVA